jgi:hypothetical protein
MWWENSVSGYANTEEGMEAGTNPAITALGTSGDFESAFQANTDFLYVWGSAGNLNTEEGMMAGTSPSISAIGASTGYQVAFENPAGNLWVYGSDGLTDTGHAMAPSTNPAITATGAGYEVAYQCAPLAPAPAPVTTTATVTAPPTTTTPVTVTTPTSPPKPPKSGRDLKVYATIPMTYSRGRTRITKLRFVRKPPPDLKIAARCERSKAHACPKLGRAKTRGTIGERISDVIAGRNYPAGVTLVLTFAARGYHSEVLSIPMPGNRVPKAKATWK